VNVYHFYDTNPTDPWPAQRAQRRAPLHARLGDGNVSDTWVLSPNLLTEARIVYLNGDPVTLLGSRSRSRPPTPAPPVPFTIGHSRESERPHRQAQFSATLSWSRGNRPFAWAPSSRPHTSGGTGSEPAPLARTFTSWRRRPKPFDAVDGWPTCRIHPSITSGSTAQLPHWLSAVFVQDAHPRPQRFDDRCGLRYDQQSLIAPRATSRRASASLLLTATAIVDSRRLRVMVLH